MDNKFQRAIINSIAYITTINNQTAIIVASKLSTNGNSITSLGAAVGTVQTSEDLNNLLNEATNCSYKNMKDQMPNFQGVEQTQIVEIQPVCSIPQTTQTIPSNPMSERHTPKQAYTKSHSTTRTASQSQQNFIKELCNEKSKNLNEVLAPYHKELSTITSAEANEIIQKIKTK